MLHCGKLIIIIFLICFLVTSCSLATKKRIEKSPNELEMAGRFEEALAKLLRKGKWLSDAQLKQVLILFARTGQAERGIFWAIGNEAPTISNDSLGALFMAAVLQGIQESSLNDVVRRLALRSHSGRTALGMMDGRIPRTSQILSGTSLIRDINICRARLIGYLRQYQSVDLDGFTEELRIIQGLIDRAYDKGVWCRICPAPSLYWAGNHPEFRVDLKALRYGAFIAVVSPYLGEKVDFAAKTIVLAAI